MFFDRVDKITSKYYNIEPGDFEYKKSNFERLKSDNYICIKCSAEKIPLPDASIDIVISISSLDHVPDHLSSIREARRLLRTDGRFILCFNNKSSWWKILLKNTNYLKSMVKISAWFAQQRRCFPLPPTVGACSGTIALTDITSPSPQSKPLATASFVGQDPALFLLFFRPKSAITANEYKLAARPLTKCC